jgi:hypothetical protein
MRATQWRGPLQEPGEALRRIVFPLLDLALRAETTRQALELIDAARPWAIGCSGELHMGHHLSTLNSGCWTVLHGVPLPDGGDIDHLVIGPGGVFAIDAKVRLGHVTVSRHAITVDARETDMLNRAVDLAIAASDVLSDAVGWKVWVSPVIAFVDSNVQIRSIPHDVPVLDARNVAAWLEGLPRKLLSHRAHYIARVAASPHTWC